MDLTALSDGRLHSEEYIFFLSPSSSLAEETKKELNVENSSFIDTSGHVPLDFSPIREAIGRGEVFSIIILDDYFEEVFGWLQADPVISEAVDTVYFYPSAETSYMLEYREKYSATPLQNMILFRSGPHATQYVKGMDYADNARALFEYLLSQGLNEKYELVWLVKDPEEYRDLAEDYENVSLIAFDWSTSDDAEEREKYYRALYLSKWIFMTDAYGFCRLPRRDQVRVQLWHGCGFKTRVNFVPCEKRYEYNVVVSDAYRKIHADIYGLREDQVLITGYPKEDRLFHPMSGWQEILCIPQAKKYIFWMPTFRKAQAQLKNLDMEAPEDETGLPVLESAKDLAAVNEILKEADACLVIRLHPFQDASAIHADGYSNIILMDNEIVEEQHLDINAILGNADALISDYSSAAVDYMILDRPMAFTIDDVEAYESGRGFVFHPLRDYLPGVLIRNAEDFQNFVADFLSGKDEGKNRREKLMKTFHSFRDDRSSERVLKALGIECVKHIGE